MSIELITDYYDNGQKKSERFWDDLIPVGNQLFWYKNGNKKYEATELNGSHDVLTIEWYEDGQKRSEGMMDDFFRIGLWTEWHENGVKKSEGFYRKPVDTEFCFEDEKFEEWIYWHKNGKLACKGFHDDWNLEGLWMFLDENGVELYKHNFKNGFTITASFN